MIGTVDVVPLLGQTPRVPSPPPLPPSGPVAGRRRWNAPLIVGTVSLVLLGGMALVPGAFTGADPRSCDLADSLASPSWRHPLGFDLFGCDLAAKVVYGARTSLLLAVAVVTVAGLAALVLGTLAGYAGGLVDGVVSRVTDVWSGIPLVLGGVILLSSTDRRGVWQVVAVLSAFSWPPMVRIVRASTRQVLVLDYVTSARALGAGPLRLLRRHVLPNATRPLAVFASAYAGVLVSAEAILTFAGVGLQRPTDSWGILLQQGGEAASRAPHALVGPSVVLVMAVAAFVLLGEGLRSRPVHR
ncbi:ABC-type dipeptide/oligopeptide/nickel transport system permease subunit [Geodermatophilus bullaregiensis]|uniref:ABC transporter permease n=1 Tax=Geodermatophilus bullaregiensis TaxID=1564160 RepID=UPI00195DF40D|nr:ABC transporter permease [Geodermatophilus bullaregiensis]MBM7804304.1 ABC-type dipeptide/oligopeptide/nickel transport system permease subunit [Geodermatophilus bullaregiensis]